MRAVDRKMYKLDLRKLRADGLYDQINRAIIHENYIGHTMYKYDVPRVDMPEETLAKLKEDGVTSVYDSVEDRWCFKWN